MTVFYKNLNSVRCIAAGLVIVHHIEQNKQFNGLPNYFDNSVIVLFGKLGVDIFFVLSGFLITSLLVIEKEKYQHISIGKFYMRRILRIWPLYFLIAILALFVWPHVPALHIKQMVDPHLHFIPNILLIFFFLPNLQLLLYQSIAYEVQAWSIGVEEQFYLFWPFVVNFTKNKAHFKKAVIGLLAAYLLIKIGWVVTPLVLHRFHRLDNFAHYLAYVFQIDCMMIGALFGLLNMEEPAKKILTSKAVQIGAYLIALGFLAMGWQFGYFYWEVYGVLFGIMILNLVNTETSLINLDFKWMDYLGKISYSMYMIHVLLIIIVIRFVTHNSFLIYPLVFLLTIIVSVLSFEFFEKPFLRFKSGFAKIQSGRDEKVGM
jgi:peptidoglycan/LPS O-acetylase OafA/YrhL